MKKLLLYLLFVALAINTSAQTMHFIYFADTNDSEIGGSSEAANRFFLYNFVPQVSRNTSLYVKKYVYYGSNFQRSKLNNLISNLSTQRNDVIFFYYTGHGFNDDTNAFPILTLGLRGDAPSSRNKSLLQIYKDLQKKPHRLLVVIAEACNSVYRYRSDLRVGCAYGSEDASNKNYRNLFQSLSGDYLMSSSKKNQKSYSPTGTMGYFSTAFQNELEGMTSYTSWSTFLNAVSTATTQLADDCAGVSQNPQWIKGSTRGSTKLISKIPIWGSSRNTRGFAKGLTHLTNSISGWKQCRNVALTQTGNGVAIYGNCGYATTSGVCSPLKEKLSSVNNSRKQLVDVTITDNNKYYCLVYGKNRWFGTVPEKLKKWLHKYNENNEKILSVSISNNGKCALITDKHYWCSDMEGMNAMREAQNKYGSANSVCITDLGIIICCKKGVYCRNIPSNLLSKLKTVSYIPKIVKFTDLGTFFISNGSKAYSYHM